MTEFRYVWEYTVEPDNLPKFLTAYQPDGDWAQLFRRDDAYLGTELLKDRRMPYRFVTIDRWESYSAYAVFRERHKDDFETLDEHCETLTTSERHLGDFEVG